jgi:hypothetical protein
MMTIQFDEKGKIYTKIISKYSVYSTIQTTTHRIEGNIYVKRGERLIDELISSGQFIAVTDAKIIGTQGEILFTADFLSLNADQIIWIIPDEEFEAELADEGGLP